MKYVAHEGSMIEDIPAYFGYQLIIFPRKP